MDNSNNCSIDDIEKAIEQIAKEQPNIPKKGLDRIKQNMLAKQRKSMTEKNFKKAIMLGLEFMRERPITQRVRLYKYTYTLEDHAAADDCSITLEDYSIGIGVLIDSEIDRISVVACMCVPEDTWKNHIARGLLGYRLKSVLEGNAGTQWYFIMNNIESDMSNWAAAQKAISILTDKGLDRNSNVPKFYSSRLRRNGIDLFPEVKIIDTPKPHIKKNTDT